MYWVLGGVIWIIGAIGGAILLEPESPFEWAEVIGWPIAVIALIIEDLFEFFD